ncbi:MAG TPA: AI-2E family transporter [Terriglobia bacterium]|nr:AI-2E family transporter [Terriglobia bacterium]
MKNLFGEAPLRVLAFVLLLVALVLAFLAIRILIVPFVAAMFVVYLFDPGITAFQRRGIERGNAFLILLIVALIAITILLMFAPAWLRLEAIGGSSDTLTQRIQIQLTRTERWMDARFPMLRSVNLTGQLSNRAAAVSANFLKELPGLITSFVVNLLLVPFIAYFMIRDGKAIKRRIVRLVPNRYFETSLIMFYRIDQQIGGYLRGRLVECILVGITQTLFMGIANLFVDQPQILLIAGVCGITNMIPYLGPVLGTVFGAFLYLSAGLPMPSIYGLVIASAAAHIVDNIMIAPTVLSYNVDLHPLTVALVLVIGGELLGALGLLIAIPVASSIKVIAQEFYANYQLQVR